MELRGSALVVPEPGKAPDSRLIFNRRRFQLDFVGLLLSCLVNFFPPSSAVPGVPWPFPGAGSHRSCLAQRRGRARDGREAGNKGEFQGLGKGSRGGSLGMAPRRIPRLDPGVSRWEAGMAGAAGMSAQEAAKAPGTLRIPGMQNIGSHRIPAGPS